MKAEMGIAETMMRWVSRPALSPAPSLRVPVTEANRALLRRLRAAEMSAWEDPTLGRFPRAAHRAPVH
jgi:hypothetical protein